MTEIKNQKLSETKLLSPDTEKLLDKYRDKISLASLVELERVIDNEFNAISEIESEELRIARYQELIQIIDILMEHDIQDPEKLYLLKTDISNIVASYKQWNMNKVKVAVDLAIAEDWDTEIDKLGKPFEMYYDWESFVIKFNRRYGPIEFLDTDVVTIDKRDYFEFYDLEKAGIDAVIVGKAFYEDIIQVENLTLKQC